MILHDVTIEAGSIRSTRQRDTRALLPGAVEVFRSLFDQHGTEFRVALPVKRLEHLSVQFTSEAHGAALATFWRGAAPLTTSALVSGADPEADREALRGLQSLVVQLFRGTPLEPGFDLLSIAERPLLVTVPIPTAAEFPRDLQIVADAETCLAAAYFLEVLGE